MKKVNISWPEAQGLCLEIARQIQQSQWMPDYVVGITRGGSIPAVLISQYLNVRCEMLKVSLRDGGDTESNCWMAEDAFGHINYDPMTSGDGRKSILIIDDINDSGATLEWIKNDWRSSCMPNHPAWEEIWGTTVRTACLIDNTASKFKIDYHGRNFNKLDDDYWFVFPWEQWWNK